jgi:hypothetical protein
MDNIIECNWTKQIKKETGKNKYQTGGTIPKSDIKMHDRSLSWIFSK